MNENRFELEPLPLVFSALPLPQLLKKQVLEAIDGGYNQLVRARGEVTRPEDTWEVQRRLATAVEQLKAFEDAFKAGRVAAAEHQRAEFELGLGDREVKPRDSMTVPDVEGDLRVAAHTENIYDIDVEALARAAALAGLDHRDLAAAPLSGGLHRLVPLVEDIVNGDSSIEPGQLPEVLVEFALTAIYTLLQCGKFEPQVTKVKAYADQVARHGDDQLAATINSAIKKTVKLKGVKIERKAAK
jgi:hypothetical protein